jgi:hypothetical protein
MEGSALSVGRMLRVLPPVGDLNVPVCVAVQNVARSINP